MIKKILKIVGLIMLALLLIVGLYFLTERILSRMPAETLPTAGKGNIVVYVMSNGVHTDIVLPVRNAQVDWTTYFPYSNNRLADNNFTYVGIGWGDKGFYLNTPEWKDLKASTAFLAATGLGETAIHVSYYKQVQESSLCFKYLINSEQYQALIDYVLNSLDKNPEGQPIVIATEAQYSNSDAFYEAQGAYSMFHSCNTWTNTGLKKANMPAGIWASFDKGILSHYQKLK